MTTLLNDVGVEISKRQVVRFLTERLDGFHAEDAAVLHAGLVSAPYVTVDDTGARHASRNFHTTHIGGEHFTAFRTTSSKSRLTFWPCCAATIRTMSSTMPPSLFSKTGRWILFFWRR
jgi:hypothetical protein